MKTIIRFKYGEDDEWTEIHTKYVQSCLANLPEDIIYLEITKESKRKKSLLTSIDSNVYIPCNKSRLSRFTKLVNLKCIDTKLTSLPELPQNLKYLNCEDNQLISLPELPQSLEYLYCRNNKLTSLPELPSSLEELCCEFNELVSLPTLPESLKWLSCRCNNLISLPSFPMKLERVYCGSNNLKALPTLPDIHYYINYDANPFSNVLDYFVEEIEDHHKLNYYSNVLNISDCQILKYVNDILIRFKYLYYCLRFKRKFIQWFLRANEKKIMEQIHPDKIIELLASGKAVFDLDKYL